MAPFRKGMGLFFFGVILSTAFLFSSCYLTKQAVALLKQRSNAQSLENLRKSTQITNEIATLISRVDKIRQFGVQQIGLKDSENYRSLVELPQDYLVTVVSACKPLSFERYSWWFPFFGSSPYLGFFDEHDALEEAKRLKDQGWEIWVRHVDAFSTLGILKDPLFSFMSKYSEYRLANLIFHEQTHATVWSAGNFDFNEQLATFMGDMSALDYIGQEYGLNSPEYQAVGNEDLDQKKFYADLGTLRERLNIIYTSALSAAEKQTAKTECIRQWQADFAANYANYYHTADYRGVATMNLNNAFLDLYQTYTGRAGLFQRTLAQSGGTSQFIALMRQAATSSNPFEWMEKRLAAP